MSETDPCSHHVPTSGDVSEDTARTLAGLRHALAQRRPFASMQPWRTQDLMVEHVAWAPAVHAWLPWARPDNGGQVGLQFTGFSSGLIH